MKKLFIRIHLIMLISFFVLSACQQETYDKTNPSPLPPVELATISNPTQEESSPATQQMAVIPLKTAAISTTATITSIPSENNVGTTPLLENQAILVRENVPDGTNIQPGEAFIKEWELKNTGGNTWGKDSYLELDIQGINPFGAAKKVSFGKEVTSGETIVLSLALEAPRETGHYTIYFRLFDEDGAEIRIHNDNLIWLQVNVGDIPAITGYQNEDLQNISFKIDQITFNGDITSIRLCASYSTYDYHFENAPKLIVDGEVVPFAGGGDDWGYSYNCMRNEYKLSREKFDQATNITLEINTRIYKYLWAEEIVKACESAKAALQAQYAGIDFGCHPPPGGESFDNLKIPAGLSREETSRLVRDTIEEAIYGSWSLKIK